jgi:N-methylhydantoinase A
MLDLHTIGAGGGSLVFRDEYGALNVGPQSAGANPGPACYARGGTQPTVTDAAAVVGRLPEDILLGGTMPIQVDLARKAFAEAFSTDEPGSIRAALDVLASPAISPLASEHRGTAWTRSWRWWRPEGQVPCWLAGSPRPSSSPK